MDSRSDPERCRPGLSGGTASTLRRSNQSRARTNDPRIFRTGRIIIGTSRSKGGSVPPVARRGPGGRARAARRRPLRQVCICPPASSACSTAVAAPMVAPRSTSQAGCLAGRLYLARTMRDVNGVVPTRSLLCLRGGPEEADEPDGDRSLRAPAQTTAASDAEAYQWRLRPRGAPPRDYRLPAWRPSGRVRVAAVIAPLRLYSRGRGGPVPPSPGRLAAQVRDVDRDALGREAGGPGQGPDGPLVGPREPAVNLTAHDQPPADD
jgi:hypothetical protein